MRVLLDEMLPWRLKRELEHEVWTVRDMQWDSIKDGNLLLLVEPGFDVFITMDRSLAHQNQLVGLDLAVILLRASSNDIRQVLPLFDEVRRMLPLMQPGRVHLIGDPPRRRRSR